MSSTTKNQISDSKKSQDNNNKEELSDSEKEIKQKMEKNSKKAAPKSKKVKHETESEDEEDEEDEQKPGLLDLPLEVTGARERKKVERLALSFHQPNKDKKTEIAEGKGSKLGECPRIEHQLQRMRVDDLKPLHKLLFNRPGAPNEIKKNIRRFSGFVFDKDSGEYEKKKASLDKLTTAILKKMCEVLDLERGGTKEDIIARILEFLLKPEPSAKKLPQSKTTKKPSTKKTKKAKNSKNSKKGEEDMKSESGSEDEEDDKNDNENDGKDDFEDEDKNDKDEEEEKNDVKEDEIQKEEKSEKKNEATKKVENKAKGKSKKNKLHSSESESSDDEPLVKKGKMPPTDDELKEFIKRILDGANLEEITMKTVCKQVYAKFPDFDLSSKKDFIKSTVRSIIS